MSESTTLSRLRSMVARLAYTPMRDLLRGRVSSRLDLNRLFADAALEAPLTDLIRVVVRRTRLLRLEKIDVAAELVAHFRDGLDAEQTPESLVASFGDPRAAARLIRRAGIRKRSAPLRVFFGTLRGASTLLAALVVMYTVAALRFFTSESNPTRDYLAEFNAALPATAPDDRAWPLYQEALETLAPLPPSLQARRIFGFRPLSPVDPEFKLMLKYVRENQRAIEIVRAASIKPALGAAFSRSWDGLTDILFTPLKADNSKAIRENAVSPDHTLLGMLPPDVSQFRAMITLLVLDAHDAAAQGDSDRALSDFDAALGVVKHIAESPLGIFDPGSRSGFDLATRVALQTFADEPQLFSRAQLVHLAHRFAAFTDDRFAANTRDERVFFEDMLQRLYGKGLNSRLTWSGYQTLLTPGRALHDSDGSSGATLPITESLVGPILSWIIADRGEMLSKYDEIFRMYKEQAGVPLWQLDAYLIEHHTTQTPLKSLLDDLRYYPASLLLPPLAQSGAASQLTSMRRDALLAVIALHIHKLDTGDWTETLDALIPGALPAIPLDRFSGAPLQYLIRGNRPILYSIGTDRDDDGGYAPLGRTGGEPDPELAARWLPLGVIESAETSRARARVVPDGNWVLFASFARDPE